MPQHPGQHPGHTGGGGVERCEEVGSWPACARAYENNRHHKQNEAQHIWFTHMCPHAQPGAAAQPMSTQEGCARLAVSVSATPGSAGDGKESVRKHRELNGA